MNAALEAGHPLPVSIQNAPELEKGNEFYLQAYRDCSRNKSYAGTIPFSEVVIWCRAHGCDFEMFDDIKWIVFEIDTALNTWRHDQQEAERIANDNARNQN